MSIRVSCLVSSLFLILAIPTFGAKAQKTRPALSAQTTAVTSRDPQALALLNAAVAALDVTTTVTDATLQANVGYTAGSDSESGPATLQAKISSLGNESNLALTLSGGQRQEIRNGIAGVWVGIDGQPHAMATHNCFTDAVWFFPGLSLQAAVADPGVGMAYVGLENLGSASVQHIQLSRLLPGQTADLTSSIQTLSTTDLYLDATSSLPVAVEFNGHPDLDANTNLLIEIQFSNYQSANGVVAPMHIQKFLQRSLLLDISVTGVTINSGIPDSVFTLPTTGGVAQ